MNESQAVIAKSISEKQLSQHVVNLAKQRGWLVARWPTWRATGTDAGAPDLLMVRGGKVLLVELKSSSGRLSEAQQAWLEAAGGRMVVWTAEDWLAGACDVVLL